MREVVPNILSLVDLARLVAVPRIYVRMEHNAWFNSPAWQARRHGVTGTQGFAIVEEGSWGARFFRLRPAADELVIVKHRYSAFDHTPLELALRSKGCETLILAGTQTHVCVEATAVDAISKGFTPIVVEDCVASGSRTLHEASLQDFTDRIALPTSLRELRRRWGR